MLKRILNYLSLMLFAGVMLFAFWKESSALASKGIFCFPDIPLLGQGDYGSSMVGTIGEVVEKENLRGKSLAVWGGDLARAHDFPFLYRVTADWFLLPEKPIPIVATAEEASKYEYILSPWDSGYELNTSVFNAKQVVDQNFVRLYRLEKIEGSEE